MELDSRCQWAGRQVYCLLGAGIADESVKYKTSIMMRHSGQEVFDLQFIKHRLDIEEITPENLDGVINMLKVTRTVGWSPTYAALRLAYD
jgi:hypothetical protein